MNTPQPPENIESVMEEFVKEYGVFLAKADSVVWDKKYRIDTKIYNDIYRKLTEAYAAGRASMKADIEEVVGERSDNCYTTGKHIECPPERKCIQRGDEMPSYYEEIACNNFVDELLDNMKGIV